MSAITVRSAYGAKKKNNKYVLKLTDKTDCW